MIFVLKSRGMAHSNQMREFVLSDAGIDLVDVYLGAGGVLTGNARVAHAAHEQASAELRLRDHDRNLLRLASRQKAIEAQIAALQAQGQAEEAEAKFTLAQDSWQETHNRQIDAAMAQRRSGGKTTETKTKSKR
jgi:circadian clock protein KaiC